MKCVDFLPSLATGGWLGRWRARRHASHCSRCAAAASLLRDLKAEHAAAPVPPYLRQMWLAAATERPSSTVSTARSPARLRLLPVIAAPCAIACLILLSVTILRWQAKPAVPQGADQAVAAGRRQTTKAKAAMPDAGPIAVVEIDPVRQLAWLDERVSELADDVEKLAKASRKREVERQIEELLASHPGWQ